MKFTSEHEELRRTVRKVVDTEINPYVDEWEEAEIFPAHTVFKKLGDAGLLGINRTRGVRRARPRLELQPRRRRRVRKDALRRRADGDRRPDRHGDARARALRLGRAAA